MNRLAFALFSMLSITLLAACSGGVGPCSVEECQCRAGGCTCPDGAACGGFTQVASCNESGSSCNLECGGGDTCGGTCGASCNLDCDGTSCELVTGNSGSIECVNGATCQVTCMGNSCSLGCRSGSRCDFVCTGQSCSMSCDADATCRMQCPGDSGLQDVVEGRGC